MHQNTDCVVRLTFTLPSTGAVTSGFYKNINKSNVSSNWEKIISDPSNMKCWQRKGYVLWGFQNKYITLGLLWRWLWFDFHQEKALKSTVNQNETSESNYNFTFTNVDMKIFAVNTLPQRRIYYIWHFAVCTNSVTKYTDTLILSIIMNCLNCLFCAQKHSRHSADSFFW